MTTTAVETETGYIDSPTFDELLKAYHDNRFQVFDWCEAYTRPFSHPYHRIRFEGEYPDEGTRARELADQNGFPLTYIYRIWDCRPGGADRPYWEMRFTTLHSALT